MNNGRSGAGRRDALIAGHNLRRRAVSGICAAVVLVLVAFFMPPIGMLVALLLVASLAQLEFYRMMDNAGIPVFRIVGLICGAALITATFCTLGPDTRELAAAYKLEQAVLIGSLIAVFFRQFPQKYNEKPLATIGCTLFGIWYVPFLFNFFTRLAFAWNSAVSVWQVGETGRQLIFYLVVVVKATDIGAFFVGALLGKHKLLPRISPNKTWEGLIGGLSAGVCVSALFCMANGFRLGEIFVPVALSLALGLALALAGTAGDMFESLLKRAAGSKDSGAIVPGMGGLLDILDSLLFGAPVLYVAVSLLVP